MIIKEMFAKAIDRDIKGVIKVGQDDNSSIKQELEEYVVTNELQKHFRDVFESYKKGLDGKTDKIGVWVSGFFGSGKSHFLKIISYLLENKKVEGKTALEYFEDDNKIADPVVMADIQRAASIPTDVVLFNIDSKSTVNGRDSKDAIVTVLQNAFNEKMGFSDSNPFLADLERRLSEEGKYEAFKTRFKENTKHDWVEARSDFYFIEDDMVKTLCDIDYLSEVAARNWYKNAGGDYPYKVETFAKLVKKYLDGKSKKHHIVFLIDEIGQYIGENSNLMLNLQTIVEDLGTECGGRAWIIVTSQQDIDTKTKVKGDDFSKIQGRFDTRLSLSSANVDEVIRKRILGKNQTGRDTLASLYEENQTVIKNLIIFSDPVEKKLYSCPEDFADVYPFVPYQFNLLGSVLTAIRTHGASGKHLAEGERSMLALFKESAVKIMNNEPGKLVPFNMFYDALEQFLDHSHKGAISRALTNEKLNPSKKSECFDVNVLKTLFLIKYVKEIQANVGNISSLMVSSIDEDRLILERKVEESLGRLVGQTLVQKSGDAYIFLTDEEQEINREIIGQVVEPAEVVRDVSALIFEDLLPDKKFTYYQSNFGYDFGFNQIVDGTPFKPQKNEISLRILTPNSNESHEEQNMILESSNDPASVWVTLPEDRSFLEAINSAIQIQNFLRRDGGGQTAKYEEIKEAKKRDLKNYREEAKRLLETSMNEADIYIHGRKMPAKCGELKKRISDAFNKVVDLVYSKISYIDIPITSEDEIVKLFNENKSIIESQKNSRALSEVEEFLTAEDSKHEAVLLKRLLDRFQSSPYGFKEFSVRWLVAKLFLDGNIGIRYNGQTVSSNSCESGRVNVINYFTRKEYNEKLVVQKKTKANEALKNSVKEVMKELFGCVITTNDDEQIMSDFQREARLFLDKLQKNKDYYDQGKQYPGLETVKEGIALSEGIIQINYSQTLFDEIHTKKRKYLDFAENIKPVLSFLKGKQREIFDESLLVLDKYENDKEHLNDSDIDLVAARIKSLIEDPNPYSKIHNLPSLNKEFNEKYDKRLLKEKEECYKIIEEYEESCLNALDGEKYSPQLNNIFKERFQKLKDDCSKCVEVNKVLLISNVRLGDESDLCMKDINEKANVAAANSKRLKKVIITTLNCKIENKADVKRFVRKIEKKLIEALSPDSILVPKFR